MKEHKGMRSHDIVILLKIISMGNSLWYNKDLAHQLMISASEVTESLNRSRIAKLINSEKNKVNTLAFMDFLAKGISYVYPVEPGRITIGVPTAHSAPPLNAHFSAQERYVWPYARGEVRGESITPLHPKVPIAVQDDPALYELLVLVDAIRIGRAREKNLAIELLNERINGHQYVH